MTVIADSGLVSLFDTVGRYVALPALLGILLLLPLYFSQRRDLLRLRAWMEREPDHPKDDLAASEALLDRAEAELATFLAARGEPVRPTGSATAVAPPPAGQPTAEAPAAPAAAPPPERAVDPTGAPLTPIPPAQRVTAERPALTRITMERAALERHPRWRRLRTQLGRPRILALIALIAVTVGIGSVVTSRLLLEHDSGNRGNRLGLASPRRVTVAVLNGTTAPGLAGKVSVKLRKHGFRRGSVGTSRKQFQQTVVMYGGGEKKAAERVAHVLGVTPVQRIDRATRAVAGPADVVVIAGADRTGP